MNTSESSKSSCLCFSFRLLALAHFLNRNSSCSKKLILQFHFGHELFIRLTLSSLSLVIFAFLGQVTHVESTWRPKLNTFRALTTISRARLCKRSISLYMDGRHEEKKSIKCSTFSIFFRHPLKLASVSRA